MVLHSRCKCHIHTKRCNLHTLTGLLGKHRTGRKRLHKSYCTTRKSVDDSLSSESRRDEGRVKDGPYDGLYKRSTVNLLAIEL